ncbi:antibiotic biosynthesis monooxygenase [Burkholderia sp. MSMB1826]|uniref:antibiotic biosynthesis monooxygenase n=1 Tax=Burkholderia sp. MSMB1826 TaxID=1637875 RepID=UPI0027BAC973|nr:antibiotic biosynthesis monooxygenase [Burkholderia sp. MSMB1826]
MDIDASPAVLLNLVTMATEDEPLSLKARTADSLFTKRQPECPSTQLHRAGGENSAHINYAALESAVAWRGAFGIPEFQKLSALPPTVVARPHRLIKVAVPKLCTA